mmetsp:Transcript_28178/g.51259  ORF Transcript_28178/g.51259 Transcript_28178/m.51259 type:complete len:271 (-) Transcript_28178:132-944(-)
MPLDLLHLNHRNFLVRDATVNFLHIGLRNPMLHRYDSVFHLRDLHNLVNQHFSVLDAILVLNVLTELDPGDFEQPLLNFLPQDVLHMLLDCNLRDIHQLGFHLVLRRSCPGGFGVLNLWYLDNTLNNLRVWHFFLDLFDDHLWDLQDFLNPNVRLPHKSPLLVNDSCIKQLRFARVLLYNPSIGVHLINVVVVKVARRVNGRIRGRGGWASILRPRRLPWGELPGAVSHGVAILLSASIRRRRRRRKSATLGRLCRVCVSRRISAARRGW